MAAAGRGERNAVSETLVRDRKATDREIDSVRRFIFDPITGIGVVEAARRMGLKSGGYLSDMLRGKVKRRLMLGEIRMIRGIGVHASKTEGELGA